MRTSTHKPSSSTAAQQQQQQQQQQSTATATQHRSTTPQQHHSRAEQTMPSHFILTTVSSARAHLTGTPGSRDRTLRAKER